MNQWQKWSSVRGFVAPDSSAFLVPAATYVGPGDVAAGALAWWGLRAFTAAIAAAGTQKLVTVFDVTQGSNTYDLVSNTDGTLNTTPLAGIMGHTFTIVTWYDQTGSGFNLVEDPNPGNRPTLVFNYINGSLPAAQGTIAAPTQMHTTSTLVRAQPFTFSTVVQVQNTVAGSSWIADGANAFCGGNAGTPNHNIFAGASLAVSTSLANWQAYHDYFNGASSSLTLNGGAPTTGDAGTGGFNGQVRLFYDGGAHPIDGYIAEAGIWPGQVNVYSNQHSYYGVF